MPAPVPLEVAAGSLPSISTALHASTGDLQWIVDAYSLVWGVINGPEHGWAAPGSWGC
jgi:hypothetical protein